jgi:arylformamidase
MPASEWIDITLPLSDHLPVLILPAASQGGTEPPPKPEVFRFRDVEKGDKVTMSYIKMASHDGTHIDAPLHFIPGGTTIDKMPVETTVGPARVIGIKDPREINVAELEPYNIREGERILFKTANSGRVFNVREYTGEYTALTPASAAYLADRKIRLVGLDHLTIAHSDVPDNINIVHKTFLSRGIFILEGIDLDGVEPGEYDMVCLPMRLEKGDAGPCRACLRPVKP